jgi:hypothetical protein
MDDGFAIKGPPHPAWIFVRETGYLRARQVVRPCRIVCAAENRNASGGISIAVCGNCLLQIGGSAGKIVQRYLKRVVLFVGRASTCGITPGETDDAARECFLGVGKFDCVAGMGPEILQIIDNYLINDNQ